MDSMHPDPKPLPPPSLEEIRSQLARLEESHRAKGITLSGRVIHVCHHLPVEIKRIVPANTLDGVHSPPMTPEFKPDDVQAQVESLNAKWRISARTGHTAMVSGIKSLSEIHEQVVVAWTGEVLLQSQSTPSPKVRMASTLPANLVPAAVAENGDLTPGAPRLPAAPREAPLKVFGGEFTDSEKKEIEAELDRFSEVEAETDPNGRLKYVPVFVAPEVSKGHYEGFCKTSAC